MSVNEIPDYPLDEHLVITAPAQLRALADPLRGQLLELVTERAATVKEMAAAVDRTRGSIAYHVNLLCDVGLMKVVRTRRVRAIDERFYGRVARTFAVGALTDDEDKQTVSSLNGLAHAVAESAPAHAADTLACNLVHARIPPEAASEFWTEVQALIRKFNQIPRSGDQVYGFAAGIYPTDAPTLSEPSTNCGSPGQRSDTGDQLFY